MRSAKCGTLSSGTWCLTQRRVRDKMHTATAGQKVCFKYRQPHQPTVLFRFCNIISGFTNELHVTCDNCFIHFNLEDKQSHCCLTKLFRVALSFASRESEPPRTQCLPSLESLAQVGVSVMGRLLQRQFFQSWQCLFSTVCQVMRHLRDYPHMWSIPPAFILD